MKISNSFLIRLRSKNILGIDRMSGGKEKFWVEDPCSLFASLRVFPMEGMTKDEKLNALTRLAIIVSAVLYYMQYEHWFTLLILSLLVVVLIKFASREEGYSSKKEEVKEDFTLVPTYASPDLHVTTISPLFSDEWMLYPQQEDLYVNTPPTGRTFEEPMMPQAYPYSQYLSRTGLLPSDEYATHMLNGGPRQARDYANSAFLRHDLGFRENMTRLYKKKLARRFRNSGVGETFSPYSSY